MLPLVRKLFRLKEEKTQRKPARESPSRRKVRKGARSPPLPAYAGPQPTPPGSRVPQLLQLTSRRRCGRGKRPFGPRRHEARRPDKDREGVRLPGPAGARPPARPSARAHPPGPPPPQPRAAPPARSPAAARRRPRHSPCCRAPVGSCHRRPPRRGRGPPGSGWDRRPDSLARRPVLRRRGLPVSQPGRGPGPRRGRLAGSGSA